MTQQITLLTKNAINELTANEQPPCLSVYQQTYRSYPDIQQNVIQFENLVRELAVSLARNYPSVESRHILKPFKMLANDHDFWTHTTVGLAVLAGPELFKVFRLQRPVPDLAIVADSFHIKPLRRILQTVGRYQVLGLTLGKIMLFEGNRDVITEIEPAPGVPHTVEEALGYELTEPHASVGSFGGLGRASLPMAYGQGSKKEEIDTDADRFFRTIDRAVLEHHSRPSGLPLILAALAEHHNLFHKISRNPFLEEQGIDINPETMSLEDLRELAWKIVEPQYHLRTTEIIDHFEVARSKGFGSDDLAEVAQAAAYGRVATLLIEADRQIAGRVDDGTGKIEFADLVDPRIDDLLDDLGELVDKKGGKVFVIPAELMPVRTGLAASYRY